MRRVMVAVAAVVALAVPAIAKAPKQQTVVALKTSDGKDAGTITFVAAKDGKLEISKFALKNIASGVHGFHIHANATCDAPDFKGAGAHMGEPTMHQHSNVTISPDGITPSKYDFANLTYADVTMKGGSIVIHEKADDMTTDPTGNAGNRIACGVITGTMPGM
jgi:superoxide dismutase, Cu-Zn family